MGFRVYIDSGVQGGLVFSSVLGFRQRLAVMMSNAPRDTTTSSA